MHRYISDTAKYGDLTRGPRVVESCARKQEMRKILKEIQSGKFARQWIRETRNGAKNYRRLLKQDLRQPIERVGAKLRERMPWLKEAR